MNINYKQVVIWDATLIDVGFLGSEQSVPKALRGLAVAGNKTTTGAPATTAGQWAPGAIVSNLVDGTVYIMNGTTATPTWEIIEAGTLALANGKIYVGNGSGVAVGVTPSGDVTISNTGAMSIGAGKVTLAKLAAGVAPAYIIKFAGTASGGTTATRAYTVTGALATDIVTCVIRASTTATTIQKATLSNDTLTVLFAADPGADTTVDYQIARIAA